MRSWTSVTGPDARSWREHLLLSLTHWSAVFGGVIALGVTVRAFASDFVDVRHPAFAIMIAAYGAIVALRFLPALPYRTRAATLSGACFVAAASAVPLRGLAAAPVLLLALTVLLAALFLGRAAMIGSLILVGATVAVLGHPEPVGTFSVWTSALGLVCVAGLLTVLVQFVVSRLGRRVRRHWNGSAPNKCCESAPRTSSHALDVAMRFEVRDGIPEPQRACKGDRLTWSAPPSWSRNPSVLNLPMKAFNVRV